MDDVITLVNEAVTGHDSYGNEIRQRTQRDVMCKIFGVNRSEFYSAARVGLKPEITARLSDHADYNGETVAVFHNEEYDIIRIYRGTDSFRGLELGNIELTLQKRVSNG